MYDTVQLEREILEKTYNGIMDVYEYEEYVENNRSRFRKKKVLNGIKCALSKKQLTNTVQNEIRGEINYIFQIFTYPDKEIKAGSFIHIKQDGMNYELENTGETFKYPTHQEIICQRKDNS